MFYEDLEFVKVKSPNAPSLSNGWKQGDVSSPLL